MAKKIDICRSDCPGWGVYNGNEIQRCDSCNKFSSDEDAVNHVLAVEKEASNKTQYETDQKAALEELCSTIYNEIANGKWSLNGHPITGWDIMDDNELRVATDIGVFSVSFGVYKV
jgi:hypothetical protein